MAEPHPRDSWRLFGRAADAWEAEFGEPPEDGEGGRPRSLASPRAVAPLAAVLDALHARIARARESLDGGGAREAPCGAC